jgi:hypothetical protein
MRLNFRMDSCNCVDGGAFEPQSGMLCVHFLSLFYMLENFAGEGVCGQLLRL